MQITKWYKKLIFKNKVLNLETKRSMATLFEDVIHNKNSKNIVFDSFTVPLQLYIIFYIFYNENNKKKKIHTITTPAAL